VRPARLVAAEGSPENRRVYSGLPYYLLRWGQEMGLLDGASTRDLPTGRTWVRRMAWNTAQLAISRGAGGYKYSPRRLRSQWTALPEDGATLLVTFQLVPRHVHEATHVRRVFFIDQTLRQLFTDYGVGERVAARTADRALQWERSGYHAATAVVANSAWAARSVVEDYGIPAERVHVVHQGANVAPDEYQAWLGRRAVRERDDMLRLVFVGRDWKRKGLVRLLEAVGLANEPRPCVSLDVVGCTRRAVPSHLAGTPHVRWHGFIDKATDEPRFLDLVGDADVGCLLSHAEAGGIAISEYHALGLAVLGTTAGGAPEHCIEGASWLVEPGQSAGDIAERLRSLAGDRDEVERARRLAWASRESALWSASLVRLDAVLGPFGA